MPDQDERTQRVPTTAPYTNANAPAPGHRLIVPLDSTETWLVDNRGELVHTWPSAYLAGHGARLEPNGTLLRAIKTGNGRPPQLAGGGVQRIAFDGTVLWDFRYDGPGVTSHHDVTSLPNGNVLLIAWEEKSRAELEKAGRHPLLLDDVFRPDHIIEVRPTGPTSGEIVWSWHVWDHLIQDVDPAQDNYGDVALHPELIDINYPVDQPPAGDYNHANAIHYDAERQWIMLSARAQAEIWVIDHSTTTAEAAGHSGGRWGRGGDLLFRWGNPQAHRAGGPADQLLFGQHSSHFIPAGRPGAGNILVFNNEHPGGSAVWEIEPQFDPATGEFVFDESTRRYGPSGPKWTFEANMFDSFIVSNCERLPNGNTLICSGFQSWILEVDPRGHIVWDYRAPSGIVFQAHYVEQTLWTSQQRVSRAAGADVRLEIVAGSRYANHPYLTLGSTSGTAPGVPYGPLVLPLNLDPYFLSTLGVQSSIVGAQADLDALGRGASSLSFPPGVLSDGFDGMTFHHAVVVYDPDDLQPLEVSGPVGFQIGP